MSERRENIEKTLKIGKHRRKIPLWARIGVVAIVGLLALWFFVLRGDQGGGLSYQTEPVRRGDLSVTVSATGTVEPTNLVEISSELSGTLASVEVDYNDTVEVGQVLARLDTTKLEAQYAVQEASLVAAEARVEQAQATLHETFDKYETARQLYERGVGTHQAFITARANQERAEAELQIADADRALAFAQLDLYGADLQKAVIHAPIKGVVLERNADAGQIVASSLSAPVLFTIAEDLASMELQVDIDEADIGRVAVGNSATFTVDAYDDETFPAEISQVRYAPEEIDGVVNYKAILVIDNSSLRLRPGMTATADIVVAELSDVLMVPNAALRFAPPRVAESGGGGDSSGSGLLGLIMPDRPGRDAGMGEAAQKTLWLLRAGQAVEIPVTLGQSDGRFTAVLDGALAEGDQVITDQTGAE